MIINLMVITFLMNGIEKFLKKESKIMLNKLRKLEESKIITERNKEFIKQL